jgi:hypothetical protein
MNERIKELKNQTLDKHFWYTWSTMDYDDVTKFAEKFAELIVRECIDTISDCSVEYCTRPQIVSEIKEHFGVEK